MTSVLYIGGSGEISQACVEESLRLGHEVSVFNRGNTPTATGVKMITGDVYGENPYENLSDQRFDVVCQFLAYNEQTVAQDIEFFKTRCEQYLFISTASVYQKPSLHHVITEETSRVNPFWVYAQRKLACEQRLVSQTDLPTTIVRPSHTYRTRLPGAVVDGNHQTWRILNNKPVLAHGDGQSLWTLTYASDFASAFVQLFLEPAAIGNQFHITASEAYTWDSIIRQTGLILGKEVDIVHVASDTLVDYEPDWLGPLLGDKSNSVLFDNQRIQAMAPNWQCEVSLAEGLALAATHVLERLSKGYEPVAARDALVDRIVEDHSKSRF